MHCAILNTITVRSDGKITCGESLGYDIELAEVPREGIWKMSDVTAGAKFTHIREAFRRGSVPWPGICEGCDVFAPGEAPVDTLDKSIVLRIEPTLQCKLRCPSCKRPRAVRKRDPADWHLTPEALDSLLNACRSENLSIESVIFLGWGEPLEHPDFRQLVGSVRNAYPATHIEVTSHGNVDYAATLSGCRVDDLIVSVDGANQTSYEKYRRDGDFSAAVEFMRAAVKDGQNVTWKYIVFDHNDSELEIADAQALAKELNVAHQLFILTNSKGRSQRLSPSNIVHFPRLTERASVSPAAAMQRPLYAFVPRAVPRPASAGSPHFNIDRCYLADGGLLRLEGWACEPDGRPLERVTVRVDGEECGELAMVHPRTDVVDAFAFAPSIRPGFANWLPVRKAESTLRLEFAVHGAGRISHLYFTCSASHEAVDSETSETTRPIRPGRFAGVWWAPGDPGWGISVTQHGDKLFVAIHRHDDEGGPAWYFMSHCPAIAADVFRGEIHAVTGGRSPRFLWNGADKVVRQAGSATLTFRSADQVSFDCTIDGKTLSLPMERRLPASAADVDYSDIWCRSGEPGWGIAFAQHDGRIAAWWYTYDDDGKAVWYVADDCRMMNGASEHEYVGELYMATKGSPRADGACDETGATRRVGSVTFRFPNANRCSMAYTLNGVSGSRTLTRLGF